MMKWFERHLNWSWVFGFIVSLFLPVFNFFIWAFLLVGFPVIAIITIGVFSVVIYVLAAAIYIGVTVWYLNRKKQSYLYLLLIFLFPLTGLPIIWRVRLDPLPGIALIIQLTVLLCLKNKRVREEISYTEPPQIPSKSNE